MAGISNKIYFNNLSAKSRLTQVVPIKSVGRISWQRGNHRGCVRKVKGYQLASLSLLENKDIAIYVICEKTNRRGRRGRRGREERILQLYN
jgi:hypothetical protein